MQNIAIITNTDPSLPITLAALKIAQAFTSELRNRIHYPQQISLVELPPGLSVHSSSGMVGMSFVVK